MALEQQLGDRPPLGARIGLAPEDRRRQRPAPLHRGLGGAPRAEATGAAPAALERRALGAGEREPRRAQRRPGVVGHLAGPDEVPQRLLDLLRRQLDLREQVGEEAGRRSQPVAQDIVGRLARRIDHTGGWGHNPDRLRRPPGSTAPRVRSCGRSRRPPPRRPRRTRTARPATSASTSRSAAAARRAPTHRRAAPGPAAARAPRAGGRCPLPAARVAVRRPARTARTRRARAARPARSPCAATRATRARIRRSTSGSHHSRPEPPGRSSPSTSSPAASSSFKRRARIDAVAVAQLLRS